MAGIEASGGCNVASFYETGPSLGVGMTLF
jgi:hypothetical protein